MCKFTVETKPFKEALNTASSFSLKTMLSTFSMIYLQTKDNLLKIRAVNANSSFECVLSADTIEDGEVTVSADKLNGIISNISADNVTLEEKENNKLAVIPSSGRRTTIALACLSAENYPVADTTAEELYEVVPAAKIAEAINHVVIAAAKETARPFLASVRFEQEIGEDEAVLNIVATNGVLLSREIVHLDAPLNSFENSCVPPAFAIKLANLFKNGEGQLASKNGKIYAKAGVVKMNCSLIAGSYPNWKRVFPNTAEFTKISVNGKDFASTLGLTSVMVDLASRHTFLKFTPGTVTVKSYTEQFGEAEQEIEASMDVADDFVAELKFNEQMLQSVVNSIKTSTITMSYADGNPLVFTCDNDEDLTYVLMHMHK